MILYATKQQNGEVHGDVAVGIYQQSVSFTFYFDYNLIQYEIFYTKPISCWFTKPDNSIAMNEKETTNTIVETNVYFDVGGTIYSVSQSLLNQFPNTMIARAV